MRFDASLSSVAFSHSQAATYPLLIQLLLEVSEHLEELSLGGKLSPRSITSHFC